MDPGPLAARPGCIRGLPDRMLWGKRADPESERIPPFLISICFMAMSSDFFEIFLPKPAPLSDFMGFLVSDSGTCKVLRGSDVSITCPLVLGRLLEGGSMILPLVTIGDDCLLAVLPFVVMAAPGLDLLAERGLSGKVVLRFGGVSCGKSGGTMGCGGGRTRGLGELGLDVGPALRPFEDNERPAEGEEVEEGVGLLRVGVDGLEDGRMADGVGVDGLELFDGLVVLSPEAVVVDGRLLEGVEAREVVREEMADGLAADDERLVGVDGLM